MVQEQRGKLNPVPDNVNEQLNEDQLLALKLVEKYGWNLEFVRQSLNLDSTFVVSNSKSHQYAVLDKDGTLDIESGIKLRH